MLYYIKHEIIGEYVQQIKDGVVVRYFFSLHLFNFYIILYLIQFVDVSWNIILIFFFIIVHYLNLIRQINQKKNKQTQQTSINTARNNHLFNTTTNTSKICCALHMMIKNKTNSKFNVICCGFICNCFC